MTWRIMGVIGVSAILVWDWWGSHALLGLHRVARFAFALWRSEWARLADIEARVLSERRGRTGGER